MKYEHLNVLVTPRFKRELEAAAKRDHRNLSDQVRLWLHAALVQSKKEKHGKV